MADAVRAVVILITYIKTWTARGTAIVCAIVFTGQAVQCIVIHTDALSACISLSGEVAQSVVCVRPVAHIRVAHRQLLSRVVVGHRRGRLCRRRRRGGIRMRVTPLVDGSSMYEYCPVKV